VFIAFLSFFLASSDLLRILPYCMH
jgi:hypothetical protein